VAQREINTLLKECTPIRIQRIPTEHKFIAKKTRKQTKKSKQKMPQKWK
jgi:hypothetical protein